MFPIGAAREEVALRTAGVLAGCWRAGHQPVAASAEVIRLLERTRCLSLAQQERVASATSEFRSLALQRRARALQLRQLLIRVSTDLDAAGIRWALLKGWSAARLYALPHVRPCGDLDLLVRPADEARARQLLQDGVAGPFPVDLVTRLAPLYERPVDVLLGRSVTVPLGSAAIPVLCPEDQLRHLALHLWKHSAWRPLWLCDVAAAVEAVPPEFDWARCLSGSRRTGEWIQAACVLAAELLSADLQGVPFAPRPLPEWLLRAVLCHWHTNPSDWTALPLHEAVRQPSGLARHLRSRCPDPVRAALRTGSPFGPEPRARRLGLAALDAAASVLRHTVGPRRNWRDPVSR